MEAASWARSLDSVLSDRFILDAFKEWLEEYSSPQYLDLHFAILAYERMVLERNPKKNELAKEIYSTFISSRTGSCEAIPAKIRLSIGEKIRAMNSTDLDPRIFSHCSVFVDDFLRRQHQEFVSSDEFIEAFNKFQINEQNANTIERKKRNDWRKTTKTTQQLTAEALLKSRKVRQTEIKLEKMYPPPTRQPYVCNATTSHNDSAVSSSFSNDTPSSTHRGTKMRQARDNPVTFTIPRVEKSNQIDGQQFDHSSEFGRKQFVQAVTNKMMRILDKIKLNDETEQRINDIEQCKYTTLDMVYGTNADEDMGKIDEEEDIDVYIKQRMKDESQRASANRSPQINDTFSPSREVQSTSNHPRVIQHHPIDRMTQSMISYPYRGGTISHNHHDISMFHNVNKISLDTFAPPPQNMFNQHFTTMSRSSRDNGSQMYDSSGIGSMAPSAFSASSDSSRDRRSRNHRLPPHFSSSHHSSNYGTTPRKHKTKQQQNMSNLITISYVGFDGVPVVAHVPNNGPMTLCEFRQYFLLNHSQLFFKTECEDGTAPYQLELINDDNQILPIFEGRITAQVR